MTDPLSVNPASWAHQAREVARALRWTTASSRCTKMGWYPSSPPIRTGRGPRWKTLTCAPTVRPEPHGRHLDGAGLRFWTSSRSCTSDIGSGGASGSPLGLEPLRCTTTLRFLDSWTASTALLAIRQARICSLCGLPWSTEVAPRGEHTSGITFGQLAILTWNWLWASISRTAGRKSSHLSTPPRG